TFASAQISELGPNVLPRVVCCCARRTSVHCVPIVIYSIFSIFMAHSECAASLRHIMMATRRRSCFIHFATGTYVHQLDNTDCEQRHKSTQPRLRGTLCGMSIFQSSHRFLFTFDLVPGQLKPMSGPSTRGTAHCATVPLSSMAHWASVPRQQ